MINLAGALILCDATPDPIRVVSNPKHGQIIYFNQRDQAFHGFSLEGGYTVIEPPPPTKEKPVAVENPPNDPLQFKPLPASFNPAQIPQLVRQCITAHGHAPVADADVQACLAHLRYYIQVGMGGEAVNVDNVVAQWLLDLAARGAKFDLVAEHRAKMAGPPPVVPNPISDAPGPQQAVQPPPSAEPSEPAAEAAPAPMPTDPERLACYERISGVQCKSIRGLKMRLTKSHKTDWPHYCQQFNLDPASGLPLGSPAPATVTTPATPVAPPAGPGMPPIYGQQPAATPPPVMTPPPFQQSPTVPVMTPPPMMTPPPVMAPPPMMAPPPQQSVTAPAMPPVMSFAQGVAQMSTQAAAQPPPPPAAPLAPPPPVASPTLPFGALAPIPGTPAPAARQNPPAAPPPQAPPAVSQVSPPPGLSFLSAAPAQAPQQAPPALMAQQTAPAAQYPAPVQASPVGRPMSRAEAAAAMGGAVTLLVVRMEDLKQVNLAGYTDANVLARVSEKNALAQLCAEDLADVKGFRKGDQVKERVFHDLITQHPLVYVLVQNFEWVVDPNLLRGLLARTTKLILVAKGGLSMDEIVLP